jgi:hypothetical protein
MLSRVIFFTTTFLWVEGIFLRNCAVCLKADRRLAGALLATILARSRAPDERRNIACSQMVNSYAMLWGFTAVSQLKLSPMVGATYSVSNEQRPAVLQQYDYSQAAEAKLRKFASRSKQAGSLTAVTATN